MTIILVLLQLFYFIHGFGSVINISGTHVPYAYNTVPGLPNQSLASTKGSPKFN